MVISMANEQDTKRHRYNVDTDRCVCGGEVVWFEADVDEEGNPIGEGCEVEGVPWGTQIDARRVKRS